MTKPLRAGDLVIRKDRDWCSPIAVHSVYWRATGTEVFLEPRFGTEPVGPFPPAKLRRVLTVKPDGSYLLEDLPPQQKGLIHE